MTSSGPIRPSKFWNRTVKRVVPWLLLVWTLVLVEGSVAAASEAPGASSEDAAPNPETDTDTDIEEEDAEPGDPTSESSDSDPGPGQPEFQEWVPPPGPKTEPADAQGVTAGDPRQRNRALWIPRVVLFLPRQGLRAVQMPARIGAYLYDRYRLPQRFRDIFLMEDGRAGIVPVGQFSSGLGGRYGARFFHRDLLGHGERVSTRATFGFEGERLVRIRLDTGRLLGRRLGLSLVSEYWLGRNTRFFGIGNGDLRLPEDPSPNRARIDALSDDAAVATRVKQQIQTYELGLRVGVTDNARVRVTTAVDARQFLRRPEGDRDPQDIAAIYDRGSLVGFDRGLLASRSALEFTYDSLHKTHDWVSDAMPSTGWFVHTEGGYTRGIGRTDPSNFFDWEADVQRLFDVYRGDRVIVLRARLAGVTGDLDDLPFVRLPELGGANHLRGYQRFRFRDRLSALGVVEYRYPIGEVMSGYLFFDTGRVFRSAEDIEFRRWRAGGGPGLVLHSRDAFIGRIHLAWNIDRSFFFAFNFNPLTT